MKKILLSSVTFLMLAVSTSAFAITSFGNFYSISTQPLASEAVATFDLNNSVNNISISADRQTITIITAGNYEIGFNVVGGLSTDGTQIPGPWSVGLLRNSVLIGGSVVASHSGTDTPDNLITLSTSGHVIVSLSAGDTIQLVNTTLSPIALLGTVDGAGTLQNTSVSINIVQLD